MIDQLRKSNHARKAVGNVISLIYIRVIVTKHRCKFTVGRASHRDVKINFQTENR